MYKSSFQDSYDDVRFFIAGSRKSLFMAGICTFLDGIWDGILKLVLILELSVIL